MCAAGISFCFLLLLYKGMKCILIRHCETDWNVAERLQGHVDTPLNDHGLEQAEVLGGELAPFGIQRIITSDLKRAVQTSDIITKTIQKPVHIDARLRECGFGKFEGLTWDEIEARFGISRFSSFEARKHGSDFRPFGGEC